MDSKWTLIGLGIGIGVAAAALWARVRQTPAHPLSQTNKVSARIAEDFQRTIARNIQEASEYQQRTGKMAPIR